MTFSAKGHRQQIFNENIIFWATIFWATIFWATIFWATIFWATIFSEWVHVNFNVLLVCIDEFKVWN